MAKKNELPTLGSEEPKPIGRSVLMLEVPAIELPGYCQRNIQLRLTEKQALRLKSIQAGLEAVDATQEDGRYVNSALDAVRWMMENLH